MMLSKEMKTEEQNLRQSRDCLKIIYSKCDIADFLVYYIQKVKVIEKENEGLKIKVRKLELKYEEN